MTPDAPAASEPAATSGSESFFRERLEALTHGQCDIESLIAAASAAIASNPDSAWELLALTDQYYRRRQLRGEIYRTIKQKFERRMLGVLDTDSDLLALIPTGEGSQVPTLGRLLRDRYVIEAFLGDGGHGTVVRALDRLRLDLPMCGRHVAIKILRDQLADAHSLAELRREFQCSQMLAHPNIVKVFEIDRDGNTTFFTMEPLQGELLHRMLTRSQHAPLARAHALTLIRKIGEALQHAHSRGVVHGNLCARKVMITDEGDIRVFGFGAYEGADRADDLRALAALAYELLTGVPAFSHRTDDRGRDLEPRRAGEPRRLRGLSARHWKAIDIGLSNRARLISVRDWLDLMGVDRSAERLPGRLGSVAPRPSRYARPEVGPLALMAAAIGGFGLAFLWGGPLRPLSFERLPAATRPAAASLAAAPTLGAWSLALHPLPAVAPSSAAFGAALDPPPDPTLHAALTPKPLAPEVHRARPAPAPTVPLQLAAAAYTVSAGQSLASITVRRTPGVRGDINFVWWTQDATARAGEDFVSVGQKVERLPAGAQAMSFLIPIAPKSVRANKKFYVMARASSSDDTVQRATVLLKSDPGDAIAAAQLP